VLIRKKSFKVKAVILTAAVIALSALAVAAFRYRLLDRTVQSRTDANLDIFTGRVLAEIEHLDIILDATKQTLNEKHIAIAKAIEYILEHVPDEEMTAVELQRLAEPLDIIELNVANADGIVTNSNIPTLIGFDYKEFESTRIYMALATGALAEISEEPRRSVVDGNEYGDINHYTGVVRKNGGFIQLGFNANVIGRLQDEINIRQIIQETKLGGNGYGLVLQRGAISAHPNEALLGRDVSNEDWYKTVKDGAGSAWVEIDGTRYYAGYKNADGYTVIALVPESDLNREIRDLLVRAAALLFFGIGFIILLVYLSRYIMRREKSKALIPVLFILSFVIVLSISFYANSFIASSMLTMEYNIEQRLITASRWLASLADVEELDRYRDVEDMDLPSYRDLRERLLEFSREADLQYAFYFRPVGDGFHLQYIVDNDFNEETRVGLDTPQFNLDDAPWIKGALEGSVVSSGLGNYTTGWDSLLSAYAPVFDRNGEVAAIAGVDIDDAAIVRARQMVTILTSVQIIAVLAIFASGYVGLRFFRHHARIAEEANATKSRFLSQVSHELRTPLNAVIGLSEIELRGELPPSSRDNIAQINQSGTYLLGIINDILDISKIETGKFDLVPVEYETPSFINDTVTINRVRIGSKPITFVLEIRGNFPRKLFGDELRVRQILNNLLSNAIKYTRTGTVTLSVSWGAMSAATKVPSASTDVTSVWQNESAVWQYAPAVAANGSDAVAAGSTAIANKPSACKEAAIRFTVRDTGIGIRPQDMEKLFTSYTQLDMEANRKIEGTGLGLTIAKRLVEMMGGSIAVESEYGIGSTFTADIVQGLANYEPIGEAAAESLRNFHFAEEKTKAGIAYAWMPKAKVLVADDIPANLQVARGLLKPYGVKVDTASSGKEAVEMVKFAARSDENYDIVFMDHMMPDMDGIEAVSVIRAWEIEKERKEQVPVIALTANALHGMREYYLEQGFQDYLSKPINPQELDEVLAKWIAQEKREERKERGDDEESETIHPSLITPLDAEAQRLDKLRHQQMALEIQKKIALQKKAAMQPADSEAVRGILLRLKGAIQNGDTETAGMILKELNPIERELYFALYDLLVENKTEKTLERIEEWLK